jgi:hypothetical protein
LVPSGGGEAGPASPPLEPLDPLEAPVLGVSLTAEPEDPELAGTTPTEESVGGAADAHPSPETAPSATRATTGAT